MLNLLAANPVPRFLSLILICIVDVETGHQVLGVVMLFLDCHLQMLSSHVKRKK